MTRATPADGKTRLITFLYLCRPAMLDRASVDDLAATYRVERKVVEYELIVARQKRAGEVR